MLEKVVGEAGGTVKLVKMNIDEHPAVAGQLGIQSIPAVIAFVDGQPVDGFMGAVPERQIREFIDKVGGAGGNGAELAETLEAAAAAASDGDRETAARLYSAVLQQEPGNVDAIGGLAGLLFDSGDRQAADGVLAQAPADKLNAPAIAAVRTKMKLADDAARLGDPVEFERRLAANPNDHQARFDLAMIENARGLTHGGGRQPSGHHQGRARLERRRGALPAAEILRSLGRDRSGDAGGAPQAVVSTVFVSRTLRRGMVAKSATESQGAVMPG